MTVGLAAVANADAAATQDQYILNFQWERKRPGGHVYVRVEYMYGSSVRGKEFVGADLVEYQATGGGWSQIEWAVFRRQGTPILRNSRSLATGQDRTGRSGSNECEVGGKKPTTRKKVNDRKVLRVFGRERW